MNNQELVQEQYGTAPLRERVNEALDRAGLGEGCSVGRPHSCRSVPRSRARGNPRTGGSPEYRNRIGTARHRLRTWRASPFSGCDVRVSCDGHRSQPAIRRCCHDAFRTLRLEAKPRPEPARRACSTRSGHLQASLILVISTAKLATGFELDKKCSGKDLRQVTCLGDCPSPTT